MAWINEILFGAWTTFVVLSPMFLLGLLVSGVLNILITRRRIESLMGTEGLKSVMVSAAAGVPLPLCSCAVVPVAITLGKKGASRSSIMSFLITTPESGVDSILVTWALMGPWAAVFRPIASFLTALLAGVLAIGLLPPLAKAPAARLEPEPEPEPEPDHTGCCHDHDHGHVHGHEHGDPHHERADDPDYIGLSGIWKGLKHFVLIKWQRFLNWGPLDDWYKPTFYRSMRKQDPASRLPVLPKGVPTIGETCRRVFRYSFIELADDILFSMVFGVVLAGVILVVFPSDLARYGLGEGWLSYLVMVVIGIPLYICASASTPIAAALMVQGLSPGAALVFILSGPATNTATIVTLTKQFGKRFVAIYLASIVVGSVAMGATFDWLVRRFGWQNNPGMSVADNGVIAWVQWACAAVLVLLTLWRFKNGAALSGMNDLMQNIRFSGRKLGTIFFGNSSFILGRTRAGQRKVVGTIVVIGYLASGIFTVPPGNVGYGKLFGKLVWIGLEPGLHILPPAPFVKVDVWPIKFPHRLTIGLTELMDPSAVGTPRLSGSTNSMTRVKVEAEARSDAGAASSLSLHLPGSPLAQKGQMAEFLTGDQNFISIVITVVYNVVDPYTYYYRVEDPEHVLASVIQSAAHQYVAQSVVSDLISRNRRVMELNIMKNVHFRTRKSTVAGSGSSHNNHFHLGNQTDYELPDLGINLQSVNLIDIHPPEETMAAFRDAASGAEDSQRSVLEAEKTFTLMIPQAAGNAMIEVKTAEASGAGRRLTAAAESKSIVQRAEQIGPDRELLENVLWFETVERALAGKEMFILPPGVSARDLILWRTVPGGKGKHVRQSERE